MKELESLRTIAAKLTAEIEELHLELISKEEDLAAVELEIEELEA